VALLVNLPCGMVIGTIVERERTIASTSSGQYQSAGGPLYSWIVLPPSTTSVCPVT
jgi:hypothetical protein